MLRTREKAKPALALACALWIILPATAAPAQSPDQQGLDISRKVERFNNGYAGETSDMEMVLINAHGDRTNRKLRSKQREIADDGDRSLIEFEWPPDVKGTRMLTWSHPAGDDDQWLFLPIFNRVKRISASNRSGSFMGSEFAYEDLGEMQITKYSHRYLGDEKLDGRKAWKIERKPKDPDSGYSRMVSWVDQEYMQPLQIDYYDRKGDKLKTATFSGYRKLKRWYRASELTMYNHQTKKKSTLTWSHRQLGLSLRKRDFESDGLAD